MIGNQQQQIPEEFFTLQWQSSQLMNVMGLLQGISVLGGSAEEVVQMKQMINRLIMVLQNTPKPELTREGNNENVTNNSNPTPPTDS